MHGHLGQHGRAVHTLGATSRPPCLEGRHPPELVRQRHAAAAEVQAGQASQGPQPVLGDHSIVANQGQLAQGGQLGHAGRQLGHPTVVEVQPG